MADEFDWIVENRNAAQKLLLDTYRLLAKVNAQETWSKATEQVKLRKIIHLQVGISFSLWRAVFLAVPHKKSRRGAMRHAEEFLKKLIQSNAIGFTDEFNSKEFSSGYYLNNAIYRLLSLKSRLEEFGVPTKRLGDLELMNYEAWDDKKHWRTAYLASVAIVETLNEKIG